MCHLRIRLGSTASAILLLLIALVAAPAAQGQTRSPWIVTMRAMYNSLSKADQCTPIEVTVVDAGGQQPLRPDGKQPVDWQDFDLILDAGPGSTPDAFYWSPPAPGQPHRFLCAKAATSASVIVLPRYPFETLVRSGNFWNGVQIIPQAVQVVIQGAPGLAAAGGGKAPGAVNQQVSQQTQVSQPGAAGGAAAGGVSQQAGAAGGAATGSVSQQAGAAPSAAGGAAAGAGAATIPSQPYASPQNQNYAGQANQGAAAGAGVGQQAGGAPGAAPGQGYAAGAGAAGGGQAAQAPTAAAGGAPALTPAVATAPVQVTIAEKKGGGGFFKKLGQHLKDKATEVTSQTAENLTNSATQMVDVTAQTGSNLVSGAAAQATSVAQSKVGSVGNALMPSALKGGANADNLSAAVASGYAELRLMRFIGNTDVLDATGRDLVQRLATVLKTTPGNYVIEAHVDLLPSPADPGASQVLSEHRAAAVKAALIAAGVEAPRLTALGYGTSEPKPEASPEGGPPSSARIVIAKLKQ
jgi:outer membrane protein OmpA-like peptidoglycan-associated protein